jgi:hypothetical protein
MKDLQNPTDVTCFIEYKQEDGSYTILDVYQMILYGVDTSKAMQMINFEQKWIEDNLRFRFEKNAKPEE